MLADGQTLVSLAPQIIYAPGGVILISVLSFNLLAERWKRHLIGGGGGYDGAGNKNLGVTIGGNDVVCDLNISRGWACAGHLR